MTCKRQQIFFHVLTSALSAGERPESRPGQFIPGIHWKGSESGSSLWRNSKPVCLRWKTL